MHVAVALHAMADGEHLTTVAAVPLAFRTASDATGHPIVFEPKAATAETATPPSHGITWAGIGKGSAFSGRGFPGGREPAAQG